MKVNRFVNLSIVVPDGRVLLHRSTWGKSTPDYSRLWKCTMLHRVVDPFTNQDTIEYFCKQIFGFSLKDFNVPVPRYTYTLDVNDNTMINMYTLKFDKTCEFKVEKGTMRAFYIDEALDMAVNGESFFDMSIPIMQILSTQMLTLRSIYGCL